MVGEQKINKNKNRQDIAINVQIKCKMRILHCHSEEESLLVTALIAVELKEPPTEDTLLSDQ